MVHSGSTTEEPIHQLEFYWITDDTTTWHPELIAGPGSAYLAPAIVRSGNSTEIAVQGPDHRPGGNTGGI
jgi:hypothetical protein